MADSIDKADILYFSSDGLVEALSNGEVLSKPAIIRESFSDTKQHVLDTLKFQLSDLCPDAVVAVTTQDCDQPDQTTITQFLEETMGTQESTSPTGQTLELSNITHAQRPAFTMLPRLRLLTTLRARALNLDSADRIGPALSLASGESSFTIVRTMGAFSGPQMCAFSGLWVRNLFGTTIMQIIPGAEMDAADWEAFRLLGRRWVPRSDPKTFVLEPNDVVLLPPRLEVIVAFHCLTNSVVEGAVFWDDMTVLRMLHEVPTDVPCPSPTDQILAPQLPSLVAQLSAMAKLETARFNLENLGTNPMSILESITAKFSVL
jgi:hypothetical protein